MVKLASKLRIIGIVVLVTGLLSGVLINIAWVTFPPPFGGEIVSSNPEFINSGGDRNINLGQIPGHPFFVNVKVSFSYSAGSAYGFNAELIYYTQELGEVPIEGTLTNYGDTSGTDSRATIQTMINPGAAGSGFEIRLRIDNIGSSPITITDRKVNVVFTIFGTILPILVLIIGLIMTAIGFMRKTEPKVKKKQAVPSGGWEPTLQWGGGSGTASKSAKKKPRMAISSPQKSAKKKKVVKKAVPKGGAQVSCKFCGKQVPSNAFFCPHCYGKLR